MDARMMQAMQTMKAKGADWWLAAKTNPLFWRGLLGAAAVTALDLATKAWIVHVVELPLKGRIEISQIFDLTYVRNRGASFGMLAGGMTSRILLSAIAIAIAGVMIWWLARLKRGWAAAGSAFIIGGALGNLHDRLRFGYVIDFLDFSGLYFPWVFNVADMAINAGFACLILDALLNKDTAAGTPK